MQANAKEKGTVIAFPECSQWGTDEMNLAEFPIGVLTEEPPPGIKTIEREDRKWDPELRRYFSRRFIVTATDKWGLPCANDNDVLLALISITRSTNNFASRRVEFTRGQIARELGWDANGRTYKRIKLALHRLAGVRINAERSWWDNNLRQFRSRDLGVLDEFDIYERYADGELVDNEGRPSVFVWSQFMFESFQAQYVKPINMEIYRRLELPIARQMFRLLDKRFYHKPTWRFKLGEFVAKIGLSGNYTFESKIKGVLKPSLAALEREGVIRVGRRYEPGDKRGQHWILFQKGKYEARRHGGFVTAPGPAEWLVNDGEDEKTGLFPELMERGLREARARELVESNALTFEDIEAGLEEFENKKSAGYFTRGPERAAGWLYKRIRDGRAPEGYQSRAKRRECREEDRRNAQENRHRQDETARRGEAERARRVSAVESFLSGLTSSELDELAARIGPASTNSLGEDLRAGLYDPAKRGALWYCLMERRLEGEPAGYSN